MGEATSYIFPKFLHRIWWRSRFINKGYSG